MNVEVAPLRLHEDGLMFIGADWLEYPLSLDVPWHERPRISVEIESEQRLIEEVLLQAVQAFGLAFQERWRPWFWVEGLYLASSSGEATLLEAVVDADGALQWQFDPSDLTIGDIQRTAAAKVQDIVPSRLLLVVSEPRFEGGNGHDALLEFYRSAQVIYPYVTTVLSVLGLKTLKDAISLRKYWRKWIPVGGYPRELLKISRSTRTIHEASRLLQINEADTPAILAFLGMSESADGIWLPGRDPDNLLLREIAEILSIAADRVMPPGSMTDAMLEIMEKPAGERAINAGWILSKHQIQNRTEPAKERRESTDRRELHWSRGLNDVIHVWMHDPTTEPEEGLGNVSGNKRIARLIEIAPFVIEARLPDGTYIRDEAGHPLRFSSFDEAVNYIRNLID